MRQTGTLRRRVNVATDSTGASPDDRLKPSRYGIVEQLDARSA